MSEKRTSSRSDAVRQRRRSRTQGSQPQKRKSRGKGKSSYRELPPITARGVVNDFAIERRKKAKRRRFNAVLSLPRPIASVLPSPHTRIHVGWRLLSFILVLLFGTGLYLFWTLPQFRVNTAQINGNQRIPTEEINAALELDGRPVFLLTPAHIREQALRAYPELASVEVSFDLPNLVTVDVTERQPLVQWQQDGGYAWIDEMGTAFLPRGEAPGLIVVQALGTPPAITVLEEDPLVPAPFITEETVNALVALAPHVPAGTPILYNPVTGLSWTDGRGWQAVFGSGDDMEVKARVYQAMVDWLTQRGIRPILINVAYPDAPFYRVEQVQVQVEEQ
ncbi:MAG: FtsQ-type POTRA domain-containing protein [Anaerolineales bacterium]